MVPADDVACVFVLRRVSQIVADYLKANYDAAVGGRTGRTE